MQLLFILLNRVFLIAIVDSEQYWTRQRVFFLKKILLSCYMPNLEYWYCPSEQYIYYHGCIFEPKLYNLPLVLPLVLYFWMGLANLCDIPYILVSCRIFPGPKPILHPLMILILSPACHTTDKMHNIVFSDLLLPLCVMLLSFTWFFLRLYKTSPCLCWVNYREIYYSPKVSEFVLIKFLSFNKGLNVQVY